MLTIFSIECEPVFRSLRVTARSGFISDRERLVDKVGKSGAPKSFVTIRVTDNFF